MSFKTEELKCMVGARVRYELLTLGEFFENLASDEALRNEFTSLLQKSPFDAANLEFPGISDQSVRGPCEFVILDAPALALVKPNHHPFAAKFASNTEPVVDFLNLGGDAQLVVPAKRADDQNYAHLLDFLRKAPDTIISEFWKRVARVFRENRAANPAFWVSTAGLGVHWLHVRFDSTPKYFRFGEYKRQAV